MSDPVETSGAYNEESQTEANEGAAILEEILEEIQMHRPIGMIVMAANQTGAFNSGSANSSMGTPATIPHRTDAMLIIYFYASPPIMDTHFILKINAGPTVASPIQLPVGGFLFTMPGGADVYRLNFTPPLPTGKTPVIIELFDDTGQSLLSASLTVT